MEPDEKPVRDARAALLELRGIATSQPGRVQVLINRIGLGLDAMAADLTTELFLAAFKFAQAKQNGRPCLKEWAGLWEATDAMSKHFDIHTMQDVLALEASATARQQIQEAA
jgi:hypothetical protein